MPSRTFAIGLVLVLWVLPRGAELTLEGATSGVDAKDWPTYNCDVLGWRYNAGETALSRANVGRLEETWRFPAQGGRLRDWRHSRHVGRCQRLRLLRHGEQGRGLQADPRRQSSFPLNEKDDRVNKAEVGIVNGIYGSALVTEDAVYFGTLAGFVYALDRATGKEKWRVDMRAKTFPVAHELNGTFASPILADGKIVIAGGGDIEQGIRFFRPAYEGFTGRGFVMALEPQSGRIAWKYDVGPKPERLDPPITIKDAWGEHVFHFGPATSTVWSTPSYHAASRTIFFGTDTDAAPRRPSPDDPRFDTRHACTVIAIDARDDSEKWVTQINRGDVWLSTMRSYDPSSGRYLDLSIGDTSKISRSRGTGRRPSRSGLVARTAGSIACGLRRHDSGPHAALHRTTDGAPQPTARQAHAGPAQHHRRPADWLCHRWPAQIVYTNGIDAIRVGTPDGIFKSGLPTGGRIVAIQSGYEEGALASQPPEGGVRRRSATQASPRKRW